MAAEIAKALTSDAVAELLNELPCFSGGGDFAGPAIETPKNPELC